MAGIPAFQSQANSTALNAAISIAKPSGVVDGDMLIGIVALHHLTGDNPVTFTWPAGWTLLERIVETSNNNTLEVRYKVASSEGANYTISDDAAGTPRRSVGAILRYTGPFRSTQPDVDASNDGDIAPDVTTTVNGELLLRVYAAAGETLPSTPADIHPSDHTGRFEGENTGTNAETLAVADTIQVAKGATGTAEFTPGSSADDVTITIALHQFVSSAVTPVII